MRVSETRQAEFKAAAMVHGGTMSGLLHRYLVKFTREVKENSPEEFKAALEQIIERARRDEEKKTELLKEKHRTAPTKQRKNG